MLPATINGHDPCHPCDARAIILLEDGATGATGERGVLCQEGIPIGLRSDQGLVSSPMSEIGKVPGIEPVPALDRDLPEMLPRGVSIDAKDPIHRMTE